MKKHINHSLRAAVGLLAVTAPAFAAESENAEMAEKKSELPPIEFTGYWRLGYNTDINPLLPASDSQGVPNEVSRHMRGPSYFNLGLGKSFENGMRVRFEVDHVGKTPHQDGDWGYDSNAEAGASFTSLYDRDFRIRELYLELPAGQAKIWAGARKFEWEDIRIFDTLNPFNLNGFGGGVTLGGTQAHVTFADRKGTIALPSENLAPDAEAPTTTVALKDVSMVIRHEIAINENRSVKPMIWVKQNGQAPEADVGDPAVTRPEIKGSTAFKVGGIYSSHSESHWANMGLWFESNPTDITGNTSGTNTSLGLMSSSSYEFGSFGVVAGLYGLYTSYKDSQQELKVADNKQSLVPDGEATTNNQIKVSAGIQPVFYVTDHFHTALDLNYALTDKKINTTDSNALFVTPILRYAMSRTAIGTPQIYTSLTYGLYDWECVTNAEGKASDTLVTTQTGFEVWF